MSPKDSTEEGIVLAPSPTFGPEVEPVVHVVVGQEQLRFFRGSIALHSTPHTIDVYASQPPSPTTTQHSPPGTRYGLPEPVFHRQDRASLLAHKESKKIPASLPWFYLVLLGFASSYRKTEISRCPDR